MLATQPNMRDRTLRAILCLPIAAFCCAWVCSAAAASTAYTIHDLSSTLSVRCRIWDMSSTGQLAGYFVADDDREHALRWSRSEGCVDLGIYGGGGRSGARGINAAGWTCGYSYIADGDEQHAHAMLWKPDGTPLHLDLLPGAESSLALSINNHGEALGVSIFVVGYNYGVPVYEKHTTLWHSDGSAVDLGILFPDQPYSAAKINDAGTILGFTLSGGYQPWLRGADGDYTYLDVAGADYCEANDLSDSGMVSGTLASSLTSELRSVVWGPDGDVLRRLSPLDGFTATMGWGINNAGFTVGESNMFGSGGEDDQIRATLWTPSGEAIDLGSLPGFEISRAWWISDDGWIVGEVGTYRDWRKVMWEPVPEPASAVVLLAGLALVPWRCHRHHG